MRKVRFLSIITILLIVTVLAACAPDRDEDVNTNNGEENDGKPEELTIWANDQEEQLEAIKEIAAKFEEKEGINVRVEPKSMLDQVQDLALAGPEGKGPDLFYQPHDQIGSLVAEGLVEPLDLSDDEISGYSDVAMESVTYQFEDSTDIYGLPAVFETYGIFYNKDIISEEPKTIDDLKMALEEHTDASKDEYGFLMKPNDLYFAYPFFSNYGGYIFGGDVGEYVTTDLGLDNEGAIEGAKLFQSFFGKGKISTSTTVDVLDGLFTEGKVGAVINGPWSIAGYQDALGDRVGFAPFPEVNGERGSTFVGVKSWMVSYYSENKDWATELALFLTNEENSEHYFEVSGELPANTSALESIEDPIYSAFTEQIEHGVPMPSNPEMDQVWEPMNDALQFIAEGDDVKEVLEEAVEQIKSNIEASGK